MLPGKPIKAENGLSRNTIRLSIVPMIAEWYSGRARLLYPQGDGNEKPFAPNKFLS